MYRYACSFTHTAHSFDVASVGFDYGTGYRQSQPRTPLFGRALSPVEALEDSRQFLFPDTGALIRDFD